MKPSSANRPRKPKSFEFDGARVTFEKRMFLSDWWWWEPVIDGHWVPKEIMETGCEAEDDEQYWRILVYWMAGEMPRYWQYMVAQEEAIDLESLAMKDGGRDPRDPEKLSPEWCQALYWRWAQAELVLANLQNGADRRYDGKPLPKKPLTVEDLRMPLPPLLEQPAMFTVAAERPVREKAPLIETPVEREMAEQGALL